MMKRRKHYTGEEKVRCFGELTGGWSPPDTRDAVVDKLEGRDAAIFAESPGETEAGMASEQPAKG